MITIIIGGPSGSGKTTLCNNLDKYKNIKCYDNDDIVSDSFFTIYKKNKKENKKFWKMVDNLTTKKINTIYNKNKKEKTKILIFVGSQKMPQSIYDNASYFYIIKITDYKKTYKRRILRDYEKIHTNYNKIKCFANKDNIENLMTMINHGLMINTELPYYKDWITNIKNYYSMVKQKWKINNIYTSKIILNKILKLSNKY